MAAGRKYDNRQRREAVAPYLLLGNVEAVATATHIPASTLRDWMTSTWWGTLVVEVRAEKGSELDGAFTRIIHEATAQLLDRLQHGDPVLVARRIKRKPVSARDLALVSATTCTHTDQPNAGRGAARKTTIILPAPHCPG